VILSLSLVTGMGWFNVLLDYAGIAVFAVSGALSALRKQLDVIGMLVLAAMTALGGGIVRDVMIGAIPPAAFTRLWYVLIPVIATVIVFFLHPQVARGLPAIILLDAAGLGLFCVTGTLKALEYGLSPLHATLLGTCTAIGGGIIRDLLSDQIPAVLYDRELYAVPALVGSAVVAGSWSLGFHGGLITVAAAVLTFTLRMLSVHFGWRTPRPRGPVAT